MSFSTPALGCDRKRGLIPESPDCGWQVLLLSYPHFSGLGCRRRDDGCGIAALPPGADADLAAVRGRADPDLDVDRHGGRLERGDAGILRRADGRERVEALGLPLDVDRIDDGNRAGPGESQAGGTRLAVVCWS